MKLHTFSVILTAWAALTASPTARAQSLQVYFGNLHSHTSYSDGRATPEVAYAHARDVAGLDFLAITEHNHPDAGRIAEDPQLYSGSVTTSLISTAGRFTENGRFIAIYGQEFSSIGSGNHANVFEVGEVIRTNDVPNGSWDKLLNDWLPAHFDSQNAPPLMLLNHPATSKSPQSKEYGIDDFSSIDAWRTKLDAHAQLINIVNGPSHDQSKPAAPSESEFLRYLNMGLHLAPTADQDNHRENWGSAADTRTAVIATELTKPSILAALRARHVYATEDRNLRIVATVNGQLAGTRFQGTQVPVAGTGLSIEVQINDDDEDSAFYTIDVYADHVGGDEKADVVKRFERSGNGTFPLDGITYAGGDQYFFIRIEQTDDDAVEIDRAWLAPVWFEPNAGAEPSTGPVLTLDVDLVAERATITNVGDAAVNLKGWTLVSVQGNQRFLFENNLELEAAHAVVVTSGPDAHDDPPGTVKWTNQRIWRNSGDPGQLLDPDGNVRAETP